MDKQYGNLKVLKLSEKERKSYNKYYICECSCGKKKEVRGSHLKSGATKSCGCLRVEQSRERMTQHGMSKTPLFNAWSAMKGRCYNKNNQDYKTYGDRGIKVFEGWRDDFPSFVDYVNANLGEKPKGYSLDRVNNDKGYEPNNLRWASPTEQVRNRTCSRKITFNDKTLTLKEWSKETGIKRRTLHSRIYRQKWSIEKSLTKLPKRS